MPPSSTSSDAAFAAIAAAGQRLDAWGFTPAAAGNVSLRSGDGAWVTAAGSDLGALARADVVWVALDPNVAPGVRQSQPSTEWPLHREVFARHPEFGAVVHCHAPYASGWAAAELAVPAVLDEAVALLGGAIPCAPYAPSGSPELATVGADALRDRSAALLAHHGLIAAGATLDSALACAEVAEHVARVAWLARALATSAQPAVPEAGQTQFASQYRANRHRDRTLASAAAR